MELDKKVGGQRWTSRFESFTQQEPALSSYVLSSDKEFVVMHGHSCLSGPVINGGMGRPREEKYKGVCGCRL